MTIDLHNGELNKVLVKGTPSTNVLIEISRVRQKSKLVCRMFLWKKKTLYGFFHPRETVRVEILFKCD